MKKLWSVVIAVIFSIIFYVYVVTFQMEIDPFVLKLQNSTYSPDMKLWTEESMEEACGKQGSKQENRWQCQAVFRPTVAVCLTGQPRDFHLTGPSQRLHLLSGWEPVDLFLNLAFDEHSYLVSVFSGAMGVAGVRLRPDIPIDESKYPGDVLETGKEGGFTSLQAAFQQFLGVEQCLSMVRKREVQSGAKYKWVMRTRADTLWLRPPPPVQSLDPSKYTVPWGDDWGGVNDRLGMASGDHMWAASHRLERLNSLWEAGVRKANGETAFKRHLDSLGLQVSRADFFTCILTHKTKSWESYQIYSTSSWGPLNAAYCRPCVPRANGKEVEDLLGKLSSSDKRRKGPLSEWGLALCDTHYHTEWVEGWEKLFDQHTSNLSAHYRVSIPAQTHQQCVENMFQLQTSTAVWEAPSPEVICIRRQLGRVQKMGLDTGGQFPVLLDPLKEGSVVYSFGVGDDLSWEEAMLKEKPQLKVFGFDGTPAAHHWVTTKDKETSKDGTKSLPKALEFRPWVLATTTESTQLGVLEVQRGEEGARKTSYSLAKSIPSGYSPKAQPWNLMVKGMSLEHIMHTLGHDRIDLLKMSLEGYELEIFQHWLTSKENYQVCQVLVKFNDALYSGSKDWEHGVKLLEALNFHLYSCYGDKQHGYKCGFFSPVHCSQW